MIEVYVDGASAGNPGRSGAGIFIKGNGLNERYSVPLEVMSNHEAEFHALIHGLKICLKHDFQIVSFRTDSQLVNEAVEREKVKSEQFSILLQEALKLTREFELFFLKWIPGRENKVADELAKRAIQLVKFDAWHYTNNNEISTHTKPIRLVEIDVPFDSAMAKKMK